MCIKVYFFYLFFLYYFPIHIIPYLFSPVCILKQTWTERIILVEPFDRPFIPVWSIDNDFLSVVLNTEISCLYWILYYIISIAGTLFFRRTIPTLLLVSFESVQVNSHLYIPIHAYRASFSAVYEPVFPHSHALLFCSLHISSW